MLTDTGAVDTLGTWHLRDISGPRCRLLLGSLLKDLWGQGKIIGIFRKKGVLFQNIYAATNLQTFNDQFGRCCDGTSSESLLKVASRWFSVTSTLARCRDNGTGVWHKLEIMFSLVSSSGKQQGGPNNVVVGTKQKNVANRDHPDHPTSRVMEQ